MKRLIVVLFILLSISAKAQEEGSVLFNVYGGYTFSDDLEYKYASGEIGEGFQYGGGFEYFFSDAVSIELKYLRLDTTLPLYYLGQQFNEGQDDAALNFILVEGTHYFDAGPKVAPFIGGGLGMGIVESEHDDSDTNFAWDLKAGVKIKTGSAVSVNIHGYLQSISSAVGNSYYYTYYGVVGVTDYVSSYQFGLGVALGFDFTHESTAAPATVD